MSVTLEQVEQLRAHAAVSYEEARRALEACDGDLLDALILLEREGYQVLRAYNGMEALEQAVNPALRLIVIDVMMPRLDGLSAVMKIRA